ncbi:MAG: hypothetical protein AAGA85_22930, partial [Bacteroidota bacterium]
TTSTVNAPKLILLLLGSLLWANCTFGQSVRLLTGQSLTASGEHSAVLLKWYSKELIYPEGVNVYRRPAGSTQWEKLNEIPIRKKPNLASRAAADEELQTFSQMVNELGLDGLGSEFLLLNVFIKSFESNDFADFLGVFYQDTTAQWGEVYTYRVQKIMGSKETLLAQSDAIQVGAQSTPSPVEGFTVSQEQNQFVFDWVVDENRFYATNIYRTGEDGISALINQEPIVLSQIEDSLSQLVYPSPKFYDGDLVENGQYQYHIVGLSFFENETEKTAPVSIEFGDVTPPPAATDLRYEQDTMLIQLRWAIPESEDIRDWTLFRSTKSDGPYEAIFNTSAARSYDDVVEEPGGYYYYVTTYDHRDNFSQSNMVFADVPDQFPPSAPMGVTLKADTGQFVISWQANMDPDLLGYQIFRTVDAEVSNHYVLLTADPLTTPEYRQRLPVNVKNDFYYFVVALDSSENRSPHSALVSGKLPDVVAPEQPVIRSVSYSETGITIGWHPNVDLDLTHYQLYRKDSLENAQWTQVNLEDIPSTSYEFTDRRALPNVLYQYRLVAMDGDQNASVPSAPIDAKWAKAIDLTDEITLKLKHRKRAKVNEFNWDELDSDFVGYMLYRGAQQNTMKPLTGLIQETFYRDEVQQANELFYQLRAYHSQGTVLKSEIIQWKK